MEKISIVVPVYNTAKYLKKCLDSIIKQTYRNIEVIVVDDGSPDESYTIYKTYSEADSRVTYIKKENAGVSEARNTGIDMATGDFIMFIDSDDWMELDGCEALIDEYHRRHAGLTLGDVYCTNEKNKHRTYCKVFSEEFYKDSASFIEQYQMSCLGYAYNPLMTNKRNVSGLGSPWNKLFDLKLIRENHLRFDSYVCGIYDDNLFTLHYLTICKSVSYISKPVYDYVTVSQSLTHKYKSNTLDISKRIFTRIEDFIKEQNNTELFIKPYYMYVIRRMSRELDAYFFSDNNPKTWKETREEMKEIFLQHPYREAILNVEARKLIPAHWIVWFGARIKSPFILKAYCKSRSIVKNMR